MEFVRRAWPVLKILRSINDMKMGTLYLSHVSHHFVPLSLLRIRYKLISEDESHVDIQSISFITCEYNPFW